MILANAMLWAAFLKYQEGAASKVHMVSMMSEAIHFADAEHREGLRQTCSAGELVLFFRRKNLKL